MRDPQARRDRWLSVPEVMDTAQASGPDLARALDELAFINRFLGGHRVLRRGLRRLLGRSGPERLTILDVGCGGADIVEPLIGWCRRRGVRRLRILCVDFNGSACRRVPRSVAVSGLKVQLLVLQADAIHLPIRSGGVDVVHFGLFLHHFADETVARLLAAGRGLSRTGVLLNDLHAHWLPYGSTRLGTRLLSRSAMVRHDGPLSVLRGFRRDDLAAIAGRVGVDWLHLERVWPFRWFGAMAAELPRPPS